MKSSLPFLSALVVLSPLACGEPTTVAPTAATSISVPFPLTKAQCTLPATPVIKARLKFSKAATDDPEPNVPDCELSMQSQANGDFATRGECTKIPIGHALTLTLQWYVPAPTVTKDLILAESVGRADLTAPETQVVEVVFNPETPSLKPKTKALSTETTAEKDRFNCDRTGSNVCDKTTPPTAGTGTDADTCSNLEELCMGTLFLEQNNNCTN
jgi:hypothetical protein